MRSRSTFELVPQIRGLLAIPAAVACPASMITLPPASTSPDSSTCSSLSRSLAVAARTPGTTCSPPNCSEHPSCPSRPPRTTCARKHVLRIQYDFGIWLRRFAWHFVEANKRNRHQVFQVVFLSACAVLHVPHMGSWWMPLDSAPSST